MTRRVLRISALIIAFALAAAACGGSDSKSVTLYSGRGKNLIGPLLEQFEEETGYDVKVRYSDAASLALTIQEEEAAGQGRADVFLSNSPGPVGFLSERGLLAKLPPEIQTSGLTNEQQTWVAITGRQRVVVYNTENIDPSTIPESIYGLTDEEWNGRVAIAPANGSFQDFFTLMRLSDGDANATKWLSDLAEGGAPEYPNNSSIVQAVARGEVDLGLVNHYYAYRLLAESPNLAIANYVFPEDDAGSVIIVTALSQTKSGDSEAAKALIEFMLSPPAQKYFADETFEYPLGADVQANSQIPPLDGTNVGNFDVLGGELTETLDLIREAGFDV
ncbi:MAG: extracellular solute-binding protein [Acidimicrobiales bacterium]